MVAPEEVAEVASEPEEVVVDSEAEEAPEAEEVSVDVVQDEEELACVVARRLLSSPTGTAVCSLLEERKTHSSPRT